MFVKMCLKVGGHVCCISSNNKWMTQYYMTGQSDGVHERENASEKEDWKIKDILV